MSEFPTPTGSSPDSRIAQPARHIVSEANSILARQAQLSDRQERLCGTAWLTGHALREVPEYRAQRLHNARSWREVPNLRSRPPEQRGDHPEYRANRPSDEGAGHCGFHASVVRI